jgi:hypothetical protein
MILLPGGRPRRQRVNYTSHCSSVRARDAYVCEYVHITWLMRRRHRFAGKKRRRYDSAATRIVFSFRRYTNNNNNNTFLFFRLYANRFGADPKNLLSNPLICTRHSLCERVQVCMV